MQHEKEKIFGKFEIAQPRGIFPMLYFFTGAKYVDKKVVAFLTHGGARRSTLSEIKIPSGSFFDFRPRKQKQHSALITTVHCDILL